MCLREASASSFSEQERAGRSYEGDRTPRTAPTPAGRLSGQRVASATVQERIPRPTTGPQRELRATQFCRGISSGSRNTELKMKPCKIPSMKVEFVETMRFNESYQRNNKAKGKKNLVRFHTPAWRALSYPSGCRVAEVLPRLPP